MFSELFQRVAPISISQDIVRVDAVPTVTIRSQRV